MRPGTRARAQLVDMRRELIERLDRAVTGGDLALLGTVQLAIEAIGAAGDIDETDNGGEEMTLADGAAFQTPPRQYSDRRKIRGETPD